MLNQCDSACYRRRQLKREMAWRGRESHEARANGAMKARNMARRHREMHLSAV